MPTFRSHLLYLFLTLSAFVALALYLVLHGVLNADEGFYLAASHFVSEGFRPYHDFGYTQGPLFPYVNLVWLELFGHSLAGQRMAGLAWTILTIALGIWWLRRKESWGAATFFVVLLLGSPVWLAFAVKGKTYAFAGLAVLIGAKAILSSWPLWARWTVFIVAAALGTGARLPAAGFFAPAFVGMVLITSGWPRRVAALALTTALAAGLLCAFGRENWDRFLFWTTEFHRDSSFYIPVWTHFVDTFRFAPVLCVFALVTAYVSLRSFSSRGVQPVRPAQRPELADGRRGEPSEVLAGLPCKSDLGCNHEDEERFAVRGGNLKAQVIVLVSLAVAFVSNLSASTTYAEYIFPFIPALAFIVALFSADLFTELCGSTRTEHVQPRMVPMNTNTTEKKVTESADPVVRKQRSIDDDPRNPWPIAFRGWAFRVLLLLTAILAGWNYPPELSRDLLLHAGQAEAFLRENVASGTKVASSMPEIGIAAGTRLPLEMAMGKFGVTEDFDPKLAAERRMLTPASLQQILSDPATLALVGSPSYNWNFFWSLPSYRTLSESSRQEIQATIRLNFRLAFMNEEYVIYRRREESLGL